MTQRVTVRKGKTSAIGVVRPNPCRRDTDGDGLADNAELVGKNLNQKVFVKKGTYVIKLRRTSPVLADTDRDGLNDKQEVTGSANERYNNHKSDPTHYDTDRGGVNDGREVKAKSDPSNVRGNRARNRSSRSGLFG